MVPNMCKSVNPLLHHGFWWVFHIGVMAFTSLRVGSGCVQDSTILPPVPKEYEDRGISISPTKDGTLQYTCKLCHCRTADWKDVV